MLPLVYHLDIKQLYGFIFTAWLDYRHTHVVAPEVSSVSPEFSSAGPDAQSSQLKEEKLLIGGEIYFYSSYSASLL